MDTDGRRLLTLISEFVCLYKKRDPNYTCKDSKEACWDDIATELGKDKEQLKTDWSFFKNKFRRMRKKNIKKNNLAPELLAEEWPLYPVMHLYFNDHIKMRNRLSAVDIASLKSISINTDKGHELGNAQAAGQSKGPTSEQANTHGSIAMNGESYSQNIGFDSCEMALYCLSYAGRLKAEFPANVVEDIRCKMEALITDARMKLSSQ